MGGIEDYQAVYENDSHRIGSDLILGNVCTIGHRIGSVWRLQSTCTSTRSQSKGK